MFDRRMYHTRVPDCPNCGAAVRDDGVREVLPCHYCGTDVPMPRRRGGITIDWGDGDVIHIDTGSPSPSRPSLEDRERRRALEEEQRTLQTQLAGWRQVTPAAARNRIVPVFAGCGALVATLILGIVIAALLDLNGQWVLNLIIAMAVAATVAVAFWTASRQKRNALVEVTNQREEAIRSIQERLRAIDHELQTR